MRIADWSYPDDPARVLAAVGCLIPSFIKWIYHRHHQHGHWSIGHWSMTIGQTPVTSPAVDLSIRSVVHCRWVEISITGATGKTPLVPVLMMIPMRRRMIITIPMMGMHDDKFSFFRRPPCLPTCRPPCLPSVFLHVGQHIFLFFFVSQREAHFAEKLIWSRFISS